MEEQAVYNLTPDTPVSVLKLNSVSKEGSHLFSKSVIESVKEGRENPLDIDLLCVSGIKTLEAIRAGIKSNVITEASKFGDKPFNFKGAELHLTSTYTAYDYSNCGYSDWNKFTNEITNLKEKLKECETFLRSLRSPIEILNSETGEVEIVSPPVKSVTEGVKVTIK